MRKYILRNNKGERVEQKANSLIEAIRLVGGISGLEPQPAKQCGGDCQPCTATQERAK